MRRGNKAAAQEAKKKDRQMKQQLRRDRAMRKYGDEDWKSDWKKFSEQLSHLGLTIKDVAGDGNCMFRAIADQMEGLPNHHDNYRQRVCDYIERNEEDYAPFVEDDRTLAQHVAEMRRNGTWGGHMELQATSMMLGINYCIHQLAQPRWELANHTGSARNPVRILHLSYHDGDHYASVRNVSEGADFNGPPTLIVLPTSTGFSSAGSGASSSNASGSTDFGWQEDLVMRSTCATNQYFVRAVLLEVGGDTDAAVEYIISLSTDGQLEESFQNEFAYEHGIFPEGGFTDQGGLPDTQGGFHEARENHLALMSAFGAPSGFESLGSFGAFPDDFDPELLKFAADVDDAELLARFLAAEASSSPSPKKAAAKTKQSKNDFKGVAKAKKSAGGSSTAPHPKLEKFYQNQHMTNKQRNAAKRMEREQQPQSAPATVTAPDPPAPAAEVPADLGSLRI